jgi:L-fuculose-phosphate aldolase
MHSNDAIKDAVHREIREKAQDSPYSKVEQLILACRTLADQNHWLNGIAGQITARGDAPGTFYTLKFGVGADEADTGNLILVDDDLRALDGRSMPNPGARFHLWVYRSHPHVQCIVHTHPAAVSALSMIGQPLSASCMDGTPFFENCGHLAEWPGLPIADEEGRIISQALGTNKALLLAHHGMLTAGATIAEATTLAIWMEQTAAAQLRAAAAGTIQPIPAHLARESRDFLLKPEITEMTFQYFARRTLRAHPDCLRTGSGLATDDMDSY